MSAYTFVARLGEGAMGVVSLVRQEPSGRPVAMKVLHARLAGDAELNRRFQREITTVSRLSHPAIIKLYDAGEEHGVPYYTMEYLEGAEPLSAVLATQGALDLETALDAMRALLDALVYCHGEGVLHRDLKPANIMFGPDARVTVMDFGIARQLEASLLTAPGTLLGTPRYMAPETIAGDVASPAADTWSAGAIFYEMLAGRPAFRGATVNDVMTAIMQKDPPPPSRLNPAVPASLDPLVMRFLQKDADDRHPSAAAALAALDAWSHSQGVRAPENITTTARLRRPPRRSPPRQRRPRPVLPAAALAGALLALLAAGLVLRPRALAPAIETSASAAATPAPASAAEAGARLRHRLQVLRPLDHLGWLARSLRGRSLSHNHSGTLPPDERTVWAERFERTLATSGVPEAVAAFAPLRDAYYSDPAVAPGDKRALFEQIQLLIELADSLDVLMLPLPFDPRRLESSAYGPVYAPIELPLTGVGLQMAGTDVDFPALLKLAPGTRLDQGEVIRGRMKALLDHRFSNETENLMGLFSRTSYTHPRPFTLPPGQGPVEVRLCVDKLTVPVGVRLFYAEPSPQPAWKLFLFVRSMRGKRRHEQRHRVPAGILPATFLFKAEVAYVAAQGFRYANTEQDANLLGIVFGPAGAGF